jgi:hypothetical protein
LNIMMLSDRKTSWATENVRLGLQLGLDKAGVGVTMARVGIPVGSVVDVGRRSSSANIASSRESWADEDMWTGDMQSTPSLWSSEMGLSSHGGGVVRSVRARKKIKKN